MKKLLLTFSILALFSATVLEASAQQRSPVQGRACGMYGAYTHIVEGKFDCGTLGKNLTVQNIYAKGWKIVSSFTTPQICTNNNGGVYTCGTGFTIFIERQ